MTDRRKLVACVLTGLVGVTLLLWLIRGPRPIWTNIPFLAVSSLLVLLAYFGVYGILYFNIRINRISGRAFRKACGLFFLGAVSFLAGSTTFTLFQFFTHRPVPAANLVALGAALGAMKAWSLQAMAPAAAAGGSPKDARPGRWR
ncbi:MAG TPA: hypothetical protein VGV60_03275 [Candidatus Polarisedimenticolia bacterium]|nr:hypothetical protein [Candidatus Polarisedimenticolia bacterium]